MVEWRRTLEKKTYPSAFAGHKVSLVRSWSWMQTWSCQKIVITTWKSHVSIQTDKNITQNKCMSKAKAGLSGTWAETASHMTEPGSLLLSRVVSVLLPLHLYSRIITWIQWNEQRNRQEETRNIYVFGCGATYTKCMTVHSIWVLLCLVFIQSGSCQCSFILQNYYIDTGNLIRQAGQMRAGNSTDSIFPKKNKAQIGDNLSQVISSRYAWVIFRCMFVNVFNDQ